ncbi:MAG: hypothetical protein OXH13_02945 [Chloroflexi bacterium]|nr:hypothetical protein [Chloroflexota bacterium]MCY3696979.1 hypothetical protein [Chloroflexota bacterium]
MKRSFKKSAALLFAPVLGVALSGAILLGCASGGSDHNGDAERTISQTTSESREGGSEGQHGAREGAENAQEGRQGENQHGAGGEGSRERGESNEGSGGEGGNEGAGGEGHGPEGEGGESREAEMSSPIIPLDQSWSGNLGGLAVSMQYDDATQTVFGTVRNTTSEVLCYVQAEPHLKSGTTTVGELGPQKLGDLQPGEEVVSSLSVSSEPGLAGVSFDGYVVHMEVFDCAGPGPQPHSGEAGEGSAGAGDEDGANAPMMPLDEVYDEVRGGARLILSYDAGSNSFVGTAENTTNQVLTRVRVEVHLSNGTELGPTTPTDLAPGEMIAITLPATVEPFDGWVAHAEVGSGEGESGHGGSGESGHESGGEHGSSGESGSESGGEHGGRGESGQD